MKRLVLMAMLAMALSEGTGILRFHVVANSDSVADQQVKLQVRDAVIDYLSGLDDCKTEAEAEAYVNDRLEEIEKVADRELSKSGMKYSSKAQTGVYDFPEKTYGDTTLPEGEYSALRITLGDGDGQNWFCVLYPPLCYIELDQTTPSWQQSDGIQYKSLIGEYLGR